MDELCKNRQRTADAFCRNHRAEQCRADDEVDRQSRPSKNQQPQEINNCKDRAADERHTQLLEQDDKIILNGDFAQGKAADNQCRGLIAGISARIHQHGDRGGQAYYERKACFDSSQ